MENKAEEDPLFLPAPFFMVRAPLLPIDHLFSLLQEKNLHQALFSICTQNQLVREAISIASPTLYQALMEGKESAQTASSLLKYLTRMCSRATPFGLFSCVCLGEWGESAKAVLDLEQVYKRARPDMEWLSIVIDQLCKEPSLAPSLSVKKNALLFESGGRVFLNYIRKKEKEEKKKVASIRLSFLTKAIFELTKHPVAIENLKEQLVLRFPSLEKERLQGVIEKLLQEEFLSFALRPSLLKEFPFAELLSQLSLTPYSASPLKEIANQIENYNQAPVGQGEAWVQQIQQTMGKVAASPNFLQVDAAYRGEKIVLPEAIVKELQEAVELLWKVTCVEPPYSPLQSYHQKFLEKYGTCRIVPLFELLNEEGGLGIPESYTSSPSEQPLKNLQEKKWGSWLQKQWAICLQEKKQEIELDEKIINEIVDKLEKETALLSFDLCCEIIADAPKEINKGDYLIHIYPFAWQGGATFGRFVDILGKQAKEKLQTFFREEEALEKNCLFVESSYHDANSSRSANVMIQPNLRGQSIDLEGVGTISLDEIYVGATGDRLYVTLKDGSKELKVTAGNMLNPTYAPIPLRFIRDISSSKHRFLPPFSWMGLAEAFFLPRVRYKKIILSAAQWKVDLFQLNSTSKETIGTIEKRFCQWADTWQLPRYILMADGDNRLLLDRHHPSHLREIVLQIKKEKEVHLIEKIGQARGQWMKSQKGFHLAECVIPFVKNKKYASPSNTSIVTKHRLIPAHLQWKLPGSEWLYVKYYLGSDNENRFLIEQCSSFARSCMEKRIITDWYFVRYADPRSHLRLRFHGEAEQILTQMVPAVHEWASTLLQEKKINDMSLAIYEREVERYGGEELIESTEALFCADTRTTTLLIQALLEKKIPLPEVVIAALSIIDLLKGFGLTLEEQSSFLSSIATSKEELAGFREWKKRLLSLSHALLEDRLAFQNDALFLHEAFQQRTATLQAHARSLREMEEKQKLTQPPEIIYDSILHMHCNRLIGRSGEEKKARLYAYHTLNLLREKQKHLNLLASKA